MRSFAIEEPGSLVPALYANLDDGKIFSSEESETVKWILISESYDLALGGRI